MDRPRPRPRRPEAGPVALGSTGIGFVPHILNVNTGEDLSSKLMAICQNEPRAVCILSANGTISTVMLRQAATPGGNATYEFIIFKMFRQLQLIDHTSTD